MVGFGFKDGNAGLAGEFGEEGLVVDGEGEGHAGGEVVGADEAFEVFDGSEDEGGGGLFGFGGALLAVVLEEGDVGDLAVGAFELEFGGGDFEEEAVVAGVEEAEEGLAGEAGPEVVATLNDGEAAIGVEFEDAGVFAGGFGGDGEFGAIFGGGLGVDGGEDEGWGEGVVVDEDDADGFGVGLDLEGGAVAAGAAVVLPSGFVEEAGEDDAEADFRGLAREVGAGSEHEADGVGERGGVWVEESFAEADHVGGTGAKGACAGEGFEGPVGAGFGAFVSRGETFLRLGVQGDKGVGHAEGFGDAVDDELIPGGVVLSGEEVAEETDGEVGVGGGVWGGAGEFGDMEEIVEGGAVVGGVGVGAGVRVWADVGGEAGEAAGVGGELFESDGGDVGVGEGEVGSEEIAEGGGEGEFFVGDGLSEEKSGEDFADGADFEEVAFGSEIGDAFAGEVEGGVRVAKLGGDDATGGEVFGE